MSEFWEDSFREKQTMWGFKPADSAQITAKRFKYQGLTNILIPGMGYGRNAKAFLDEGLTVTGIEISETAIGLAKEYLGEEVQVHHGPVDQMPYDQQQYDGIFCYALIHLLDAPTRAKLIEDCYQQLKPGGSMVFLAISTKAFIYGDGRELGKHWYETPHGVRLYFYDAEGVQEAFGRYGLVEALEVLEPAKVKDQKPQHTFWQITCRKASDLD